LTPRLRAGEADKADPGKGTWEPNRMEREGKMQVAIALYLFPPENMYFTDVWTKHFINVNVIPEFFCVLKAQTRGHKILTTEHECGVFKVQVNVPSYVNVVQYSTALYSL
jgi:hypothetical protein